MHKHANAAQPPPPPLTPQLLMQDFYEKLCGWLTRRTDKCVIATAGCQVDMKALQKLLQSRNVMFQHNHGKPMSCKGAAQLLSNTLYYKRFFPYYTFNLCAGLDDEGDDPASFNA